MNEPNNISIDTTYQDAFESYEAPFQSADWEDMLSRLESNKIPVILPPHKHLFSNLKNNIIMILFTTLASGLIWFASPVTDVNHNITSLPLTTEITTTSVSLDQVQSNEIISRVLESILVTNLNTQIPPETQITPQIGRQPKSKTLVAEVASNPMIETAEGGLSTVKSIEKAAKETATEARPDTARFLKTVVSRTWVDTTYKEVYVKPYRDIDGGWIGVYFTQQTLDNALHSDSFQSYTETYGFNLQFMSGNLIHGQNLAIYGGLDWGMQFYGRSGTSEVLINSVNEDRGLTFLRRHSNDIFISSQIEWAQFPIIPYLTGSAGVRILTTGQTTKALLQSSEYESSTDDGVHTRAALATKVGAGLKVRVTPRLYLDVRYEFIRSNELQTVDYNNSSFNGLDYDLGMKKVNLNADQFRFGVVFDVSSDRYDKVVDQPAHWEETTQNLYIDPQDSTKVFVPCPCDKKKTTRTYRKKSYNPGTGGGIFTPSPGSGSGSGSGKKSFPGVKKPPVRW
ncbi:MAG: hypothetical protein ACI9JN_001712 [Bacteroidia bacterium]|jgi:hypothetical protein